MLMQAPELQERRGGAEAGRVLGSPRPCAPAPGASLCPPTQRSGSPRPPTDSGSQPPWPGPQATVNAGRAEASLGQKCPGIRGHDAPSTGQGAPSDEWRFGEHPPGSPWVPEDGGQAGAATPCPTLFRPTLSSRQRRWAMGTVLAGHRVGGPGRGSSPVTRSRSPGPVSHVQHRWGPI